MAKGDTPETQTVEPASAEPAGLSAEYHAARRNLNAASAVFLAWELLGLRLKPLSGTSSEGDVLGFKVQIQSSGAIPWVLLAMVLFFSARLWIEWLQCARLRRATRPAVADLTLSGGVALVSLLVFVYQEVRGIQVFDRLRERVHDPEGFDFMVGAAIAMVIASQLVPRYRAALRKKHGLQAGSRNAGLPLWQGAAILAVTLLTRFTARGVGDWAMPYLVCGLLAVAIPGAILMPIERAVLVRRLRRSDPREGDDVAPSTVERVNLVAHVDE
jgi:hypothetical protein